MQLTEYLLHHFYEQSVWFALIVAEGIRLEYPVGNHHQRMCLGIAYA